jgi:hypothetical protein
MNRRLRRLRVSVAAFSVCALALIAAPNLVFGESECNLGCRDQCPDEGQADIHCQAKCGNDSDCVINGCSGILHLVDCPDPNPG